MSIENGSNVSTRSRLETTSGAGPLPEWLLAALPPLVVGLMVTALVLGSVTGNRLVVGGATPFRPGQFSVWQAIAGVLAVWLIGAAVLAALRGLPRWSYTWAYGSVVLVSFVLVLLADDQPTLISPLADALIGLTLLGILAGVGLIAARRGKADALLAGLGFCAAFVLVSFSAVAAAPFRRVDLAVLALPAALVFSAGIAAVARGEPGLQWVALVVTVGLAGGLMWLYAQAISGVWASSGSRFATRVVQIALIGLLGPAMLAWVLQRRRPAVVV
ncbi:MAG: hypothetical protein JSW37_14195 [Anaerolineales bacterium]|nr:MAG: hypothetical protein JSW37_14195 [Anaerolineales bacterium]